MRPILFLSASMVACSLAGPTLAQSPDRAPAVEPAIVQPAAQERAIITRDGKATRAKDGKICKSLVKTGSRLPTPKVCKTPEEWEAQQAASKDELDELTRRNLAVNAVGGT